MGYNRRKIEEERQQAAAQEAASRRATEAQILDEDAERLIAAWNVRQARRMPLAARADYRRRHCGPLLVPLGALPGLPQHQCRRFAHARSPP